jgi:hypothetical protein
LKKLCLKREGGSDNHNDSDKKKSVQFAALSSKMEAMVHNITVLAAAASNIIFLMRKKKKRRMSAWPILYLLARRERRSNTMLHWGIPSVTRMPHIVRPMLPLFKSLTQCKQKDNGWRELEGTAKRLGELSPTQDSKNTRWL